jgi:drug/metabolite transporter (DMT)-like permease
MASIYLKEKISNYDWLSIVTAFIGILLIQNPFGKNIEINGW